MAEDNAATGGMLVIIGIIIAVAVGFFIFKQGGFNSAPSGPEIKIELPANPVKQ